MLVPTTPADEAQRLASLHALQLLDTPPEERFDRLTRLACRLFGVPVALISLVDTGRQWFKSAQGVEIAQSPREISFCGHAILGDGLLEVPDATQDPRFADNPLVTGPLQVRFYAGCPLRGPDGAKLGTLCLIDRRARQLDEADRAALQDLTAVVEREIAAVALATTDELTGLANRRGLMAMGRQALPLCTRMNMAVTMAFLDVDDFKSVNDRHGHAEGDRALKAFAALLTQTLREADLVARLGGDEFVALMLDCAEDDAGAILGRLQQAVAARNPGAAAGYTLRFSAGTVTMRPPQALVMETLLERADAAMYERKRARRGGA